MFIVEKRQDRQYWVLEASSRQPIVRPYPTKREMVAHLRGAGWHENLCLRILAGEAQIPAFIASCDLRRQ